MLIFHVQPSSKKSASFFGVAAFVREATGLSASSVPALLADERYLNAQQALQQGLVDSVIPVTATPPFQKAGAASLLSPVSHDVGELP